MRSLSHLLSDFFNPVYGYRVVQKRGLTIVYSEFRAEIWTKSCPLFWWRTRHQTTHFVGSLVSCCCSVAFMVNSDGVWVRGTGRRMMLQHRWVGLPSVGTPGDMSLPWYTVINEQRRLKLCACHWWEGEQHVFGFKSPWEEEGITALDLRFWWSPFSQMANFSCEKLVPLISFQKESVFLLPVS